MITESIVNSVLEPLSEATKTTLSEIQFFPSDYLEISVDDELERFEIQAKSLAPWDPVKHAKITKTVVLNGEKFYDTGFPSRLAAEEWVRRIPERKKLGFGWWRLGGTDFTALVIASVWPREKILFRTPEAKTLFEYLLSRFFAQNFSAKMTAKFKLTGELPEMPDDFVDHPDLPLSAYQKAALLACLEQESKALFMEQGTGKTAVSVNRVCLEAHRKRRDTGNMYRVLVLCPNAVRRNWENEFSRFATRSGKVAVLRGGQIERGRCLIDACRNEEDCDWSAAILSIDSCDSMIEMLKRIPWDLVILDESHYIKSYGAKRSKAVRELEKNSRQRMILTGTPFANTPFDIFSQFEFLGKGLSGFMSFSNFRSFHGSFKKIKTGGTAIQKLVGIKGVPLLQERLARLAFMITKHEAGLQLPDKVYDIYEVEMTPRQSEIYKKVAKELVAEIEDGMETGKITADHVLTMLLRLAQITSGHIKFDEEVNPETLEKSGGHVVQIDDNNPKIKAILEMLADSESNEKAIVWAVFVEDIRIISEALHKAGIKHVGYHDNIVKEYRTSKEESERVFNLDPECRVFIGNPQSAGEGLNLLGYDRENPDDYDTYCNHEIFMSCNWSAVQRSQAEDRAHRRGTRMPVRITDLVVPQTIDEEIRARVLQKRKTALMIQDVRDILRRIV